MNTDKNNCGTLSIVATPIGNLKDITLRALDVLKSTDIIAAEDTRRTIKLLNHYNIKKRLISYHEHSGLAKESELIHILKDGKNIALVSDAGTPVISDPGYMLVKKCIEENIPVESIPGSCAAVTAVTLSGMDLSQYIFCGFLDAKGSARKKELRQLHQCRLPIVLYESPNRVMKTLADVGEIWGRDIKVCAARELTKIHEEVVRGSVCEVEEKLSQKEEIRGEFVIIIDADKRKPSLISEEEIKNILKEQLSKGFSKKEAAKITAKRTGLSKNEIYKLAVRLDPVKD